ncbi:glycerol-3-phosphate acyltransferase 2 mitochondrial [Cricetulus griseus]
MRWARSSGLSGPARLIWRELAAGVSVSLPLPRTLCLLTSLVALFQTSLWSSGFGMKMEAITPFLGKYRPFMGRCCQTCTPKSWESLFHRSIMDLGFCNVILVKEENTRVQSLLSGRVPGGAGEGQAPDLVMKEVQRILGHIQATLCPFLLRLFSWALLWFLNRLFLNVQLHKGQMKMVHKAVQEGLGVVRVALDPCTCSPALRALLRKLGGLFLPPEANLSLDSSDGILARTVVCAAVEQLLASGQPLLIFLEEPPGYPGPRLSALGQAWLGLVVQVVQEGIIPDATLVPVAIAYDLVPDAPCDMNHGLAPLGLWTGALAVFRKLCNGWGCNRRVCVRVHFAQPFSLQGVVLSQLLGEFSWLTEETLLRGFDVGFSGQLRCLAQHTLSLLRAHVVLLRVHQGDLVVVPRPGPGLTHLARLSMELLPTFLSEAVGACAVRGLLAGRVPPEGPWELQGIELLSQNELYRQILLLLHLLPQDLLLPQPCQSSYCYCQEVLDRLIQCGLLVAEELSQQSRCPDFFLFLCRLLSPILKAFAQAAAFLHVGQLPDSECADPNLAVSAIWTFKDLGVLQQMPSPAGPQLHLSPTFANRDNQDKLEQFIRQFICN